MSPMDADESLRRFGLRPRGEDLDEVRRLLRERTAREQRAQGDGDTELMKLCCVQLFNGGNVEDAEIIWAAKESSFDAHCSIDVQLLCGAGLETTKTFLGGQPWAADALVYLTECEAAGDFDDFTVESRSAWYTQYYQD